MSTESLNAILEFALDSDAAAESVKAVLKHLPTDGRLTDTMFRATLNDLANLGIVFRGHIEFTPAERDAFATICSVSLRA